LDAVFFKVKATDFPSVKYEGLVLQLPAITSLPFTTRYKIAPVYDPSTYDNLPLVADAGQKFEANHGKDIL
jgi:hypothetical protein